MIVTGKAPNPTKMVSLRIPTTSMRPCALLRRARLATTANSQNISFLPAITSTSTRMHGEFLRLLFLQAHRETTAHFTACISDRPVPNTTAVTPKNGSHTSLNNGSHTWQLWPRAAPVRGGGARTRGSNAHARLRSWAWPTIRTVFY